MLAVLFLLRHPIIKNSCEWHANFNTSNIPLAVAQQTTNLGWDRSDCLTMRLRPDDRRNICVKMAEYIANIFMTKDSTKYIFINRSSLEGSYSIAFLSKASKPKNLTASQTCAYFSYIKIQNSDCEEKSKNISSITLLGNTTLEFGWYLIKNSFA